MEKFAFFGLGNPGPQYVFTRHNAGFLAIDDFIGRFAHIQKEANNKLYKVYQTLCQDKRVFLIKPLTYMNLSGTAVKDFIAKNGIDIENCVVVYDDVSLALGRIRLRKAGSAGGQKGMKSIISELGTEGIKRIKIGIGPKDIRSLPDYVLSKFRDEDIDKLQWSLKHASLAMKDLLEREDFESIMNTYNGISWEGDDD